MITQRPTMLRPPSPRAVVAPLRLVLVGLFLAYSACSQGDGQRCQQNSDCSSGFCYNPGSIQTAEGGRCCASATACVSGASSDGAIDGGVMDGGPDSSSMDAPMESLPVDAPTESLPVDAPMESLPVDAPAAETSDDTMSAGDAAVDAAPADAAPADAAGN